MGPSLILKESWEFASVAGVAGVAGVERVGRKVRKRDTSLHGFHLQPLGVFSD